MTILIIEDEPGISSVLRRILARSCYPVASVTNGFEALLYLQQQLVLPRLILLDLRMPVMTGWEFREEQRRDPTLAHIPVVIVSALPDLQEYVAALDVQDYLAKPFTLSDLLSTVARYYRQGAEAEMIV